MLIETTLRGQPPRVVRSAVQAARSASTPLSLRASLILVCLIAAVAAANVVSPSTLPHDDPELARLLRGMALIKATIVFAAAAVLWWRFGRPVPRVAAAVYLAAVALMTGATVSIWQLSSLLPAAVLFHVGLIASLPVALCLDDDATGRALHLVASDPSR